MLPVPDVDKAATITSAFCIHSVYNHTPNTQPLNAYTASAAVLPVAALLQELLCSTLFDKTWFVQMLAFAVSGTAILTTQYSVICLPAMASL